MLPTNIADALNTAGTQFMGHPQAVEITAPSVFTFIAAYRIGAYENDLFGAYFVDLPPQIATSFARRRASYLAGRYLAGVALGALGLHDVQVAMAPDRSPSWPTGVVGSITHTDDFALCSVASQRFIRAVGVDLEKKMSAALVAEVSDSVLSAQERSYLCRCGISIELACTIAFSAKESLYKALFPEVLCFFDFDAAAIVALDREGGSFELVLMKDLDPQWVRGTAISGRFQIKEDLVLTSIVIPHVS